MAQCHVTRQSIIRRQSHTRGSIVLKLNQRKSYDAKSCLVSFERLKWEYPAFVICVKYSERRLHSHHSEARHSRRFSMGLFPGENDAQRERFVQGFIQGSALADRISSAYIDFSEIHVFA
jgi:hypothetical protein